MEETTIKIIFFILLIAINLVRFYYQYKFKSENLFVLKKGKESLSVVIFYVLFAVPSLLYVFTNTIDSLNFNFPVIVRFLGMVAIAISFWLFISTHRTLGKNFSAILTIKKDHKLIQEGPYKRVRHPMYTAIYFIIYGFFLLSSNLLIGILPFISFSYLYFSRVKQEEEMMLKKFGKEYEKYMKRTGRLIPKI
ncbi:isoprenylcysteine carboxylmethyltransferase family protein [Candidatus Pacearchaeota archaeon]|nr:isoprenylcysteine carboxylmethyltransferase family protein [Candidatus Pacearchaeota archaeon]